ncbi:hypothetical protein K431DRAFT_291160 [Polychaeton citri CBS 116435]|uniref:CFEM domain-containing protein n=1 Tax=Polychaeton citri CBS 116435 TaxID=1314669 RepID=A0A9P4QHQ5_9PEZI|nr:hypothetical protein K431DRAFT_291160 [Polychaeton citri CBS 116435]
MRSIILAGSIALFSATALSQTIPSCALSCFTSAISDSGCQLGDNYCACKTNGQEITDDVTNCLVCNSDCSQQDLANVASISNEICVSALSVSGESYSPPPTPTPTCAGGAGAASTTAASDSGTSSSSGSASTASSSSSGASSVSSSGTAGAGTSTQTDAAASSAPASPETQSSGDAAAPKMTAMAMNAIYGAAGLLIAAL